MISSERGPAAEATERAAARLPAAKRSVLAGYDAAGSWSDAVAERTQRLPNGSSRFSAGAMPISRVPTRRQRVSTPASRTKSRARGPH